ncbi:hypothetical protein CTZ27_29870 [Streptomyces griseocarneus]|nr:hypothetical protein CTZ27_29870 [Streptomyces griseocarneus]
MTIGVTFGWLVALACAAIAAAKALPPSDVSDLRRRPLVPPGPLQWLAWTGVSLGSLQAGRAVGLFPQPSAVVVSAVQVVLWIAGVFLLLPVVRRVRSTRRWDAFFAPIVIELLPELTAVQRRVPDTAAGDLLEQSRTAAGEGRGLHALGILCQAAEHIQHHQAPDTDEWATLYGRLERLRRVHTAWSR